MRSRWLEGLYHFASPSLQSLWVTGHDEVLVTFTECMEVYLTDFRLINGCELAISEGWMSEAEAAIAQNFHHLVRNYKSPYERAGPIRRIFMQDRDSDVLADPHWAEVVRAAQQVWLRLKVDITDSADRKQMEDNERCWGKITVEPG